MDIVWGIDGDEARGGGLGFRLGQGFMLGLGPWTCPSKCPSRPPGVPLGVP